MAEPEHFEPIPGAALPNFARGKPQAWRGSIAPDPNTVGDTRRIADPFYRSAPVSFPVVPVKVTAFSAGNRWRHFITMIPVEWWKWQTDKMTRDGEFFVVHPE